MKKKISRLGSLLPEHISTRMTARNVTTVQEALDMSDVDLMELLDLPIHAVREAILSISDAVCPPCQNVAELQIQSYSRGETARHLQTKLSQFDQALCGGLPLGAVTELVGPAGVGKTQFCFMLSICCTLLAGQGGLEGTVIYVDTESKFNSERLVQIAMSRYPNVFTNEDSIKQLTSKILVVRPASAMDLLHRLEAMEGTLIDQRVRLLIVDSIASLVRSDYGRDRLTERQQLLSQMASRLKYLAESLHIAVLVTNQVMSTGAGKRDTAEYDFVRRDSDLPAMPTTQMTRDPHESFLTAALGTKWAHCVNVRLIMETIRGERYLKIGKSPVAPCVAFSFAITESGIMLKDDTIYNAEGADQMSIRNDG